MSLISSLCSFDPSSAFRHEPQSDIANRVTFRHCPAILPRGFRPTRTLPTQTTPQLKLWPLWTSRILHLAISPEEMTSRLEKRANFDDRQEAIQKRLTIYRTKTVPVLEKYCHKVVHVSISIIEWTGRVGSRSLIFISVPEYNLLIKTEFLIKDKIKIC